MTLPRIDSDPLLPWTEVEDFIPNGFKLSSEGVFNNKPTPELISGPCWISESTRSISHMEWGRVISFIDHDGEIQQIAVCDARFTESSGSLPSELHEMGLHVIPGQQRLLLRYLASYQLPASMRRDSVSKVGWRDCAEDESPVYVTPTRTIGLTVEKDVVFQPEEHSQTLTTMHERGNLRQWQEFVASPCSGNPILVFALCSAFAGPLLKLAGQDCGGFHFYGTSSRGKTTLLQVGASAWGCGADPSSSEYSYISRWNTTGNALEATASAHNDGLLCLDEMGTCDQRDFGKVIYDLFGGQGKRRLNKNAMLQKTRTWRLFALSTGEISVEDKIREEGGRPKIGHQVRMIDISIGDGVIESSERDPRQLVNDLKKYSARFYGTAGPQFVEMLSSCRGNYLELRNEVQILIDELAEPLISKGELESFQERVLRRMCVVAAAGLFASEFKILPIERTEILSSLLHVWQLWLSDGASRPPTITALIKLREFLLANQARFQSVTEDEDLSVVRDLAGYTKFESGRRLFLLTESSLAEAVKGSDVKTLARELANRNMLYVQEPRRLKSKHVVHGRRPYFYAIRDSLLEFDG